MAWFMLPISTKVRCSNSHQREGILLLLAVKENNISSLVGPVASVLTPMTSCMSLTRRNIMLWCLPQRDRLFFCAFPFSVSLSIFFILVGELPYFILAHCNINVVVLSRNKIWCWCNLVCILLLALFALRIKKISTLQGISLCLKLASVPWNKHNSYHCCSCYMWLLFWILVFGSQFSVLVFGSWFWFLVLHFGFWFPVLVFGFPFWFLVLRFNFWFFVFGSS